MADGIVSHKITKKPPTSLAHPLSSALRRYRESGRRPRPTQVIYFAASFRPTNFRRGKKQKKPRRGGARRAAAAATAATAEGYLGYFPNPCFRFEWGSLPASNPVALVPDRSSNEHNFSYTAIGNQRHRIRSGLTPSLNNSCIFHIK